MLRGTFYDISVSAGESAVPELHRPPLLLSAAPHLLLSGTSLSHDAAGEATTVFHPQVRTQVSKPLSWEPQNKHGTAAKQIQIMVCIIINSVGHLTLV